MRKDKCSSDPQFLKKIHKCASSVDRHTQNTPFLSGNRQHLCSTLSLSFLLSQTACITNCSSYDMRRFCSWIVASNLCLTYVLADVLRTVHACLLLRRYWEVKILEGRRRLDKQRDSQPWWLPSSPLTEE